MMRGNPPTSPRRHQFAVGSSEDVCPSHRHRPRRPSPTSQRFYKVRPPSFTLSGVEIMIACRAKKADVACLPRRRCHLRC